jgi:two-component system OmpR family response regulator
MATLIDFLHCEDGPAIKYAVMLALIISAVTALDSDANKTFTNDNGKACRDVELIFARRTSVTRIVIVDDEGDSADSMAMLLRLEGHDVKVAYSGEAALKLADEWKPDFVLLDVTMPRMGGLEVAKKLWEQDPCPVIIVAVTGKSQEEDKLKAKEAGADHYLVKPIEIQDIKAVLEQR